ncbi:hypothetical protein BJX96DRAFT_134660 [Aspergillus floccosus]
MVCLYKLSASHHHKTFTGPRTHVRKTLHPTNASISQVNPRRTRKRHQFGYPITIQFSLCHRTSHPILIERTRSHLHTGRFADGPMITKKKECQSIDPKFLQERVGLDFREQPKRDASGGGGEQGDRAQHTISRIVDGILTELLKKKGHERGEEVVKNWREMSWRVDVERGSRRKRGKRKKRERSLG